MLTPGNTGKLPSGWFLSDIMGAISKKSIDGTDSVQLLKAPQDDAFNIVPLTVLLSILNRFFNHLLS